MRSPRVLIHLMLLCLALLRPAAARAQQNSTLRIKSIATVSDTLRLDSLPIVPGSLQLFAPVAVDSSYFGLDAVHSLFWWKKKPSCDSVELRYRVLSLDLNRVFRHKSDSLIREYPRIIDNPYLIRTTEPGRLDFGNMAYNGSFARGLSFGNTQNLVLNSSFNLQLNGELADGIQMRAALTDNNIPIQPEGNTQQIQDFDRVFIEFSKNENRLKVGDFYLSGRPSHFLNYNKNLQGASLEFASRPDSARQFRTQFSAAVSKGAFARNTFMGREGDQGPYRLQSGSGQNFIIVIAGTEKVWIDGRAMKRGAEYDYVIDYNAGEITFTPNRLITKDLRIVVEFEYAVQNYFRTLMQNSSVMEGRRSRWKLNFYNEQDARNQPLFDPIDSLQQEALAQAGDRSEAAVVPGYRLAGYDAGAIRYERKDTLVAGMLYDPVFVYSNDSARAVWQVKFSFVGEGKGHYRIAGNNVNGRVYEWVAPEDGRLQGAYEPVIRVQPPRKLQMISLGHEFKRRKGNVLKSEITLSNKDLNTFSPLDDGDNKGLAAYLEWKENIWTREDSSRQQRLQAEGRYEFTARNFSPVTNYRAVEFTRNWNLPSDLEPGAQHLGNLALSWSDSRWGKTEYGASFFISGSYYQGVNQTFNASYRKERFEFESNQQYLSSRSGSSEIRFYRPRIKLLRKWKSWQAGITSLLEDNRVSEISDSLTASSFSFDETALFMERRDSARNPLRFAYMLRRDRLPKAGRMTEANRGRLVQVSGSLNPGRRQRLQYTLSYRNLKVNDSSLSSERDKESILGRLQYSSVLLGGLVKGNMLLETGSGQEQKREYVFLKVADGQGNYIWNDDGDGIEEIGEFEPASEADLPFANYVRVITPTSEFVATRKSAFNLGFNIQPSALLSKDHFLAKWSQFTAVQINKQVLADGGLSSYNPFQTEINDTALISLNSNIRSTLYFDRSGRKFSASATYLKNNGKQLLTFGSEERLLESFQLMFRWNYRKNWESRLEWDNGSRGSRAGNLENRNFRFRYLEIKPSFTYQSGQSLRITLQYQWARKENEALLGGETAVIQELSSEGRYNLVNKSKLSLKVSYTSIAFTGENNTPLSYAMLSGLSKGSNYQWNINYEYRLANNVELSFQYNGQKRGATRTRHTGSMQMRALF